jgi:hypothetical protein
MMSFLARSPAKTKVQDSRLISKSPLLFSLLDRLDPDKRYEILDTGPASADSIDTLSNYHCKLHITDSRSELCAMNTDELDSAHKLNRAFVKSLQFYKNQKASLDLILLWDLPNYLQADILSAMITYLLPHTSKDAYLHCYIHTASMMPENPGKYSIMEDSQVRVEYDTDNKCPCPAYYQEALHKLMYPFKVKRSILHTNGIQEYMLSQ